MYKNVKLQYIIKCRFTLKFATQRTEQFRQ